MVEIIRRRIDLRRKVLRLLRELPEGGARKTVFSYDSMYVMDAYFPGDRPPLCPICKQAAIGEGLILIVPRTSMDIESYALHTDCFTLGQRYAKSQLQGPKRDVVERGVTHTLH
tara:strand:- start:1407 stop:1748 length:342 start_codon:yes stop_codon:yes gene_type:complete